MELIYDYMKNEVLRHKLNALTKKTFGFDFESWVNEGYFEGDYIPYSFMENGKIVSNVSANKMSFIQNGVRKNYIQIGTVMTDEAYRRRGFARRLLEHVLQEYENTCDGFYLFADLSALDFYRKAGFEESFQYRYSLKKESSKQIKNGIPFQKADEGIKERYMEAVRNSAVTSSLEQINKFGLQMFYTANLCNVYYSDEIDCFVIMEHSDDTLLLQSVISKEKLSLKDVIAHIGSDYDCLKLGFSPCSEDAYLFESSVYDGEDDYRLFCRGKELKSIEKEMLFFPQLSHA